MNNIYIDLIEANRRWFQARKNKQKYVIVAEVYKDPLFTGKPNKE